MLSDTFAIGVNKAPMAIIAVTSGYTIFIFNDEAERMFGWARSEVIGQPLTVLLPKQIAEPHQTVHFPKFSADPHTREMAARQPLKAAHRNGHEFAVRIHLSGGIVRGKGPIHFAYVTRADQGSA